MKHNEKQIEMDVAQDASMDHVKNDEFLGEYKEYRERKPRPIYPGDQVIMTKRYEVPNAIIGRIWTVLGSPKYIKGRYVVNLDGYKGSYPVDGLRVVG